MTLEQLKYFAAAVRCLSFTEASRGLYITQSTLSRQIQALEEELDAQLFVREKKSLKLTPSGVALYREVAGILKRHEELVQRLRLAEQDYEGQLRIGILDIYDTSELFLPAVKKYLNTYPKVRLALERAPLAELLRRIDAGELDAVCTYDFTLSEKPDLVTADLQEYNLRIMLNRDHPLAHASDLTLEDFKNEYFVRIGEEPNSIYKQQIGAHLLKESKVIQVKNMEDVLPWVEMGCAVAITSDRTIEQYNPQVVLRELNLPEAEIGDVVLAWNRNNTNPSIPLFRELVEKTRE